MKQAVVGSTCALFLSPRRWSSLCSPSPCCSRWGSAQPSAPAGSARTVSGGGRSSPVQATNILEMQSLSYWCTVSVKEKPPIDHYRIRVLGFQLLFHWANSGDVEATVLAGSQSSGIWGNEGKKNPKKSEQKQKKWSKIP